MRFLLSRGGRYTEEDAKAILVQILSVVSFCHLQGVVHRDLKPEVFYFLLVYLICTDCETEKVYVVAY